jgi:hypothetical protein
MGKGTISWFSNSPDAPTGYGMQTQQVIKRLVKDKYDVAILSNYGHEGVIGSWNDGAGHDVRVYPRGAEVYSQDITPLNHMHWKGEHPDQPDAMVTLYDVWILRGKKYDDINVASWTPVDHHPMPPKVGEWLAKPNVTPLAMSKFGQSQMAERDIEAFYVPHAVEKVFQPTPNIGDYDNRNYLGIKKDAFVVGMNAANKANGMVHRKAFAENLLAFSIFAKEHPEAVLYIHSEMFGVFSGWNLTDLMVACGIDPKQVVLADQIAYRYGIPQADLAGIYSAFDVFLGTSYGEGFGVGTIEAQACGVPVIVSDFAASPELVGDGWLVQGQPLWDNAQKAWFNIPSIPGIVEALNKAYKADRGPSSKALEFAKQFDADFVYETHWKPVLDKLLLVK